ncbi:hypothetical protein Cpir12675_005073 [Ceratocystis pirilliformis]|uniref:DUF2428 domain-containing protein n=1 Tax=Ceratocystis pirilliformis TaxID=259994 RepID=A0ABR3YS81_9PEZI
MEGLTQIPQDIANSKAVTIVQWIQSQPEASHSQICTDVFATLCTEAAVSTPQTARDRFASFVELCGKSKASTLRNFIFSKRVCLDVYSNYMAWSSEDNDRSLRHVLDLVNFVIANNPDKEIATAVQETIADSLIHAMLRQSTKPVVKASMKLQTLLISKGSLEIEYISDAYAKTAGLDSHMNHCQVWCKYISEVLQWMSQQFICQVAGKLIATVYISIRSASKEGGSLESMPFTIQTWRHLLTNSLGSDPSFVVAIMNYIFLPLFKAERSDSLLFLEEMNRSHEEGLATTADLDSTALMQLAALQVGKKAGLVEEPVFSKRSSKKSKNNIEPIILKEQILDGVLGQASYDARLLAMSLLVSSSSTTRPYSTTALNLLRKYIPGYFSESDAKFRVDFLGIANSMYRRIRGAIALVRRSMKTQLQSGEPIKVDGSSNSEPKLKRQKQELQHTNVLKISIGELEAVLKEHQEYLEWYLNFIKWELVPTASYQRHTMGLKVLVKIIKQENDEARIWAGPEDDALFFETFDESWSRVLFDLLMDPFDDIRDGSALVLKAVMTNPRFSKFLNGQTAVQTITKFLPRATSLATVTGRADYANGVARTYDLLYRFSETPEARLAVLNGIIATLSEKVALAQKDLGVAVLEAPTHGEFASLGYILQTCQETTYESAELQSMLEIQTKLISFGTRMWELVCDILCDNSPEGFLPDDLEEVDGIGTKDVLSFSFRSVDESSKLLRTIIIGAKNLKKPGLIFPSRQNLIAVGDLAFTQLATLRHRGAFTTAAHTFASCCQISESYEEDSTPAHETLLAQWYQRSLEAIFNQESTTRRSAGIPAMFTGIMMANSQNPSFDQVMSKLIEIAGQPASTEFGTKLCQVHALNSLKDIFKSSQLSYLGVRSDKYLSKCLALAANCLQSSVWAIRNCGLILLRSIMDCLLGTNENKTMIEAGWDGKALRIQYDKYQSVPPLLLQLLKEGSSKLKLNPTMASAAEAVFPALDIIRRAGPPKEIRDGAQKYIAEYLDSPVWHVREIAACALCSCLLHGDWMSEISILLDKAFADISRNGHNYIHGVLLAFGCVLQRHCEVQPGRLIMGWKTLLQLLKTTGNSLSTERSFHPEIFAAFLALLSRALEFCIEKMSQVDEDLFAVSLPSAKVISLGSLARIQYVRWKVSCAVVQKRFGELNEIVEFVKHNPSTATMFLDTVHDMLKLEELSISEIRQLAAIHMKISCNDCPYDLIARNLAAILTHTFSPRFTANKEELKQAANDDMDLSRLMDTTLTPAVGDGLILLSGVKMLRDALAERPEAATWWKKWAVLMRQSVHDDQPFDTRYAAVSALATFFSGPFAEQQQNLPDALFALYDALNDDDDQIRELAATALSPVLSGATLVPVEAAVALSAYMQKTFAENTAFRQEVLARMTGYMPWSVDSFVASASNTTMEGESGAVIQLKTSLTPNNALFAVEEKNLFIDEIRETQRWRQVFAALAWTDDEAEVRMLTKWTAKGLDLLVQTARDNFDGPIGWASKPAVFAVAARILVAARELMNKGLGIDIEAKMTLFEETAKASSVSGLLLEM